MQCYCYKNVYLRYTKEQKRKSSGESHMFASGVLEQESGPVPLSL